MQQQWDPMFQGYPPGAFFGKGMGHYPFSYQTYPGYNGSMGQGRQQKKGKGKGKGKVVEESPTTNTREREQATLKAVQKENLELKAMVNTSKQAAANLAKKTSATADAAGTPPKAEAPVQQQAEAAKGPTMYNNKGVVVGVAWTCGCGQSHWSAGKKSCANCGKSKDSGTLCQVPEAKPKLVQGLVGKPANLALLQKHGGFMHLAADASMEGDTPMVVEQNALVAKCGATLNLLKESAASATVIASAQAELDAALAVPPPKEEPP